MVSLTKSWTYIFKEKNKFVKLGIPLLVIFLIGLLIAGLVGIIVVMDNSAGNSYQYESSSEENIGALVFMSAFFCLWPFIIALSLILYWYHYENAQAGIQNRETKSILEVTKSEVFKKIGKFYLVDMIYQYILQLFSYFLLVAFIPFFILFPLAEESGSDVLEILVVILLCCAGLLFFVALSYISFIVLTPATLRLIETNTFSQAFKIKENWKLLKQNHRAFLNIFLVTLFYEIGIFIIGIFLIVLASLFIDALPILGWAMMIVFIIFLTILWYYYSIFVYPHLIGQWYRELRSKFRD
jgi:hypothetical protein